MSRILSMRTMGPLLALTAAFSMTGCDKSNPAEAAAKGELDLEDKKRISRLAMRRDFFEVVVGGCSDAHPVRGPDYQALYASWRTRRQSDLEQLEQLYHDPALAPHRKMLGQAGLEEGPHLEKALGKLATIGQGTPTEQDCLATMQALAAMP